MLLKLTIILFYIKYCEYVDYVYETIFLLNIPLKKQNQVLKIQFICLSFSLLKYNFIIINFEITREIKILK